MITLLIKIAFIDKFIINRSFVNSYYIEKQWILSNKKNDDFKKLHFVNKKKSTSAKLAVDKKFHNKLARKNFTHKNFKVKITMIGQKDEHNTLTS